MHNLKKSHFCFTYLLFKRNNAWCEHIPQINDSFWCTTIIFSVKLDKRNIYYQTIPDLSYFCSILCM